MSSAKQAVCSSTLRFHAVANSNSEYDQSIKLKVRDAVLDVWRERSPKDQGDAVRCAQEMLPEIEKAANDVLKAYGAPYEAKAEVVTEEFPEKQYGDIILPDGTYDAVRVVLGKGEGENFFCIMFPSMCDSVMGSEEIKEYYENEGGAGAVYIINGSKNKISIKLKGIELINKIYEKIMS